MKKTAIVLVTCLCLGIIGINRIDAKGENRYYKNNSDIVTDGIEPRALEYYTITKDAGITESGGYVTWKATIGYDQSNGRRIFKKIEYTTHFSHATPTYSLDHYTMSHSLNSIVTSGEKIIIKFYVSIFPGMPLIERTCSLTV